MLAVSSLNWARRHKREFDGVITIEDPDIGHRGYIGSLRFHQKPAPDHLILRFFDLDYPLPEPHHQPWMHMATQEDVVRALAFAKQHDKLLVHCKAGVARSTGVALAILIEQSHDPQVALDTLLQLQPIAVPNLHVVALTDEVLGYDGALCSMINAWDQSIPGNQTRRTLCRMAHFYAFGIPISAAHMKRAIQAI